MSIDDVRAIDVGCGALEPIRSSRFATLYRYDYVAECAPVGADDKQFELAVIVATTKGRWEFHGLAGRAEVDGSTIMLGEAGDAYSCRHDSRSPDGNLAICLRPGAIDPGIRLFSQQIVPSSGSLRLIRAIHEAASEDAFDSLVFTLFDEASRLSLRGARVAPSNLRMQRAKRFLERHAFEAVRLEDLAGEVGLSPFTTVRHFRMATGKTPHSYLLDLRLERAKQMLQKNSGSVEEVARAVGLSDLAYFSRFFKQRTGVTPTHYRASAS